MCCSRSVELAPISGHCLAVRYRLPFICDDPDVVGLGVDPVCCLDKVGDDLS